MRVSIGSNVAFRSGLLVAAFVLAGGLGQGQQMAGRFHVPSGTGATISVAMLRIPEKAWKHFAKAKDAAEHKRLAEADRETAKALAIAPDFAAAYLLRADSEVQTRSFKAAIADVKEARRVEPNVMWAGVVLAGAYNGLRQYEEARDALLGVHGAEAESWQAAHERARTAIGLKDVEGAMYWSEIALDSAPENFPGVHLVRTNALLMAHRWSEAEAQMEAYLQSNVAQERRSEVLAALEAVKLRARDEELHRLASR